MKRFTIKQLMSAVAAIAGLLVMYRAFGLAACFLAVWSLSMAVVIRLIVRRNPRLAARGFLAAAVLSNVSIALVCSYLYSIMGITLMALISSLTIPQVIGCGSVWAAARSPTRRIPREAAWLIVGFLSLLPVSMIFTLWPLHLAFLISRPAMDRLADRVAAGEAVTIPEWAGLYYVVGSKREPSNGNLALIIDSDPAGNSGFVRITDTPESFGPMVNLNFNEHVAGPWRYQNED